MANRMFSGSPLFNPENAHAKAVATTRSLENSSDFSSPIKVAGEAMSIEGTVKKTFILTGLMLVTTFFSMAFPSQLFLYLGAFGGLAVVIWASFQKEKSNFLAPLYALLEGLFVGTITNLYMLHAYKGIAIQAILLTMAILFLMLFVYSARIIKITEKFKFIIGVATGAVFVTYLMTWILGMFGLNVPFMHDNGIIGIGVSLAIIVIASLNFLVDFDNIEKGVKFGLPKHYEWYSAMSILITIVWLYVEILRLLSKLQRD